MKKIHLAIFIALISIFCSERMQSQDFKANSFIEGAINTFATADMNSDGLVDLVGFNYKIVGATDLEILINNSDTSLIFETKRIASSNSFNGSLAVGDIDGDSDIDIAVSIDAEQLIHILWNNGDGNFTQEDTGLSGVNQLSFIDLEGDGDLDLIGYVFNNNIVSTFINDGNGVLSDGITTEHANDISSVDYGDIDNDGDVDFVLSVNKFSGETVAIYLNDSLNNFSKLSSFDINALNSAVQVKLVDLNQDGKMDVLGLNNNKLTAFLQNDIFGFIDQDIISPDNEGDLAVFDVADFDGNGSLDIVIGDLTANLHWYKNQTLLFTQMNISNMKPMHKLLAEDFDGDGDIDFVASNGDFRAYRNDIEQMPSSVLLIPESEMVVFPNPADDFFEISSVNGGVHSLKMFNVAGKLLRSETFTNSVGVSLEGVPAGIYTLHIRNKESSGVAIKKLTKI